jgi:hypothetical protein
MVPQKVRVCLYKGAHRSGVAWWIEAESKRDRVENGRYLLVDGRWRSRIGDGLHRYLRYEANAQQVLCEGAGVISPDSCLEGVNRANLKFTNLITTTSRVSIRNIKRVRERGRKTNRKRIRSVTRGFVLLRFSSRKPTPR